MLSSTSYVNGPGSTFVPSNPPVDNVYGLSTKDFFKNNLNYYNQTSIHSFLTSEALRSFPSGHSSFTFACMIYLILVIIDKYHHLYDRRIKTVNNQQLTNQQVLSSISSHRQSLSFWDKFKKSVIKLILPLLYMPELSNSKKTIYLSQCQDCYHKVSVPSSSFSTSDSFTNHTSPIFTPGKITSISSPRHLTYLPHSNNPSRATAYTFYVIIPLLTAATIAISRIWDFWHHPEDVVAGSLIGVGCAFAVRKMLR